MTAILANVPSDAPKSKFTEEEVLHITSKYGGLLEKIIRARLHGGMRSEFDTVDIMQMVWGSIFKNQDWLSENEDNPSPLLGRVH